MQSFMEPGKKKIELKNEEEVNKVLDEIKDEKFVVGN